MVVGAARDPWLLEDAADVLLDRVLGQNERGRYAVAGADLGRPSTSVEHDGA